MIKWSFHSVLVILTLCVFPVSALSIDSQKHELDFVMAHKPDNGDNRMLISEFSQRVYDRTGGQVKINPIMPNKMREGQVRNGQNIVAFNHIYSGEVEMGQISVKRFFYVAPEAQVVDMPMLFDNHEHVAEVLDGDIGKDILAAVYKGSNGNLRGLGFTYSGGFRCLYTTKPVNSLSDLKGKTTRFPGQTMTRDMVDYLGMKTTHTLIESASWRNSLKNKTLEVEEAELIRLATYEKKYPEFTSMIDTVLETNHNLYLTILTINGKVYDRLSKEQQQILDEEAYNLALKERELSIRQAEETKERFQKEYGIKFVTLSDEDQQLLRKVSREIYAKYDHGLGELMQAISDISPHPNYASVESAE